MGRAEWSPSRLSRRRRVLRRHRAFRAPARLLAWPYQHGRPLLLQLRTLGDGIWPNRLGCVAERSGLRWNCPDRRERHCHCCARPATWSQGDRADGRAMIILITNLARLRLRPTRRVAVVAPIAGSLTSSGKTSLKDR